MNKTSEQRVLLTQIALTAANAKILGPAIMRQGLVFSLLKPARHHTVINKAASLGVWCPIGHGADVQGFLTVEGFKTRMDAARMIGHDWPLFSEDLW